MLWKLAVAAVAGALVVAGCDSGESEAEKEREGSGSPAAQVVRDFYDAANEADGEKACALLTRSGVRTVVRVPTRAACVRTVDALAPGSFESDKGELVDVEGVEERGDGFDVEAVVKGRSEGVFSVLERDGRLVIDRFESEEG